MVDKFGQVMVYVDNPRVVADFWIDIIGFTEGEINEAGGKVIAVEVRPKKESEASIVFFDKAIVKKASPELSLGTPSILFSTNNLKAFRAELKDKGVNVGEIIPMGNKITFNFSDIEENYFAVGEVVK